MKLVLIEVKAEISVNTTDKEFLAFLNDTQQMTSWFDNTQQIKQSTSSKGDAIIMFQFKSVFISKRRQMVVKYKTIKLNADKTLITIIDQGEQLDPTLLF
ncbi:hypothetical protein [Thalassotalea piscium]|uniref:SRPBCC domain-containing protein n=1 Tax=Thalassotalea piscium TaxID=1230533 RepID=A0A7X0NEY5_9GAMM|nr:hypothetical protein [Thalassotalea piscium]MBB6542212.1 hypothetical protein [Thalassotalea piscium]